MVISDHSERKSTVNSTETNEKLISLKEQVSDLVAVVKSNQNQINYHGNKRKNPQANNRVGAQIDESLQSRESVKSEGPQTSVTGVSRGKQRSVQCWQYRGLGHTSKQFPSPLNCQKREIPKELLPMGSRQTKAEVINRHS